MSALALLFVAGSGATWAHPQSMELIDRVPWSKSLQRRFHRSQHDESQILRQFSVLLLSLAAIDQRLPLRQTFSKFNHRFGSAYLAAQDFEDFDKLTVPALKEKLRSHGLPVSGSKGELVARLSKHFNDMDNATSGHQPVNALNAAQSVLVSASGDESSSDTRDRARSDANTHDAVIDAMEADDNWDVPQAETSSKSWSHRFTCSPHADLVADDAQTPLFKKAISERIAGSNDRVVLDLATGPNASLAIEAARAGAARVYAIASNAVIAMQARGAVAVAKLGGKIQILQGMSTSVILPEKVDLVIFKMIGNVSSCGGVYPIIADAHARFVKNPSDPLSWIPHRIQTLGAPASYAFMHPEFDWFLSSNYNAASGDIMSIRSNDQFLFLLAKPAVLEDVRFTDLETLHGVGYHNLTSEPVFFDIEPRLRSAEQKIIRMLTKVLREPTGDISTDVEPFARAASRNLSGIALRPRLELDPLGKLVVGGVGNSTADPESNLRPWLVPLSSQASEPSVPLQPKTGIKVHLHVDMLGSSPADTIGYTLLTEVTNYSGSSLSAFDRSALFGRVSASLRELMKHAPKASNSKLEPMEANQESFSMIESWEDLTISMAINNLIDAQRITCIFNPKHFSIQLDGRELVGGELKRKVSVEDCSWDVDIEPDGRGTLAVVLGKRFKERWNGLFAEDADTGWVQEDDPELEPEIRTGKEWVKAGNTEFEVEIVKPEDVVQRH